MRIQPDVERQKKIVQMRKDGMSLRAIGNEFGITKQRVKQLLDVDYNMTNHNFGKRQIDNIKNTVIYKELSSRMMKYHVSIRKMAKDMNISYFKLRRQLSGESSISIADYDEYLDYLNRFARIYRKEYENANRRH